MEITHDASRPFALVCGHLSSYISLHPDPRKSQDVQANGGQNEPRKSLTSLEQTIYNQGSILAQDLSILGFYNLKDVKSPPVLSHHLVSLHTTDTNNTGAASESTMPVDSPLEVQHTPPTTIKTDDPLAAALFPGEINSASSTPKAPQHGQFQQRPHAPQHQFGFNAPTLPGMMPPHFPQMPPTSSKQMFSKDSHISLPVKAPQNNPQQQFYSTLHRAMEQEAMVAMVALQYPDKNCVRLRKWRHAQDEAATKVSGAGGKPALNSMLSKRMSYSQGSSPSLSAPNTPDLNMAGSPSLTSTVSNLSSSNASKEDPGSIIAMGSLPSVAESDREWYGIMMVASHFPNSNHKIAKEERGLDNNNIDSHDQFVLLILPRNAMSSQAPWLPDLNHDKPQLPSRIPSLETRTEIATATTKDGWKAAERSGAPILKGQVVVKGMEHFGKAKAAVNSIRQALTSIDVDGTQDGSSKALSRDAEWEIARSVDELKVIETVYGYHAGMKYAQRLLEAALEQKIAKDSPVHQSFSLFSQTTLLSFPGSVLSEKRPEHKTARGRTESSSQALFSHSSSAPVSDSRVHRHVKNRSGDAGLNLDMSVKTSLLEPSESKSPAHAVVEIKKEKTMEDQDLSTRVLTPSIKKENTDISKQLKESLGATKEAVIQQVVDDEVEEGEVEGEDEDLEGGNAPVRITFSKAESIVQPKEALVQPIDQETNQAPASLTQGQDEDLEDLEDEDTVMEQSSVPKPRHSAPVPTIADRTSSSARAHEQVWLKSPDLAPQKRRRELKDDVSDDASSVESVPISKTLTPPSSGHASSRPASPLPSDSNADKDTQIVSGLSKKSTKKPKRVKMDAAMVDTMTEAAVSDTRAQEPLVDMKAETPVKPEPEFSVPQQEQPQTNAQPKTRKTKAQKQQEAQEQALLEQQQERPVEPEQSRLPPPTFVNQHQRTPSGTPQWLAANSTLSMLTSGIKRTTKKTAPPASSTRLQQLPQPQQLQQLKEETQQAQSPPPRIETSTQRPAHEGQAQQAQPQRASPNPQHRRIGGGVQIIEPVEEIQRARRGEEDDHPDMEMRPPPTRTPPPQQQHQRMAPYQEPAYGSVYQNQPSLEVTAAQSSRHQRQASGGRIPPTMNEAYHHESLRVNQEQEQYLRRQEYEYQQQQEQRHQDQQLQQEQLRHQEQQRKEQQRLEQQRLEQQRLEQQRLEQQRLEQQRLEQQRLEQQRLEQQRLEQQRQEQLYHEQQRQEQQRQEQQRQEQQRLQEQQRQQLQHAQLNQHDYPRHQHLEHPEALSRPHRGHSPVQHPPQEWISASGPSHSRTMSAPQYAKVPPGHYGVATTTTREQSDYPQHYQYQSHPQEQGQGHGQHVYQMQELGQSMRGRTPPPQEMLVRGEVPAPAAVQKKKAKAPSKKSQAQAGSMAREEEMAAMRFQEQQRQLYEQQQQQHYQQHGRHSSIGQKQQHPSYSAPHPTAAPGTRSGQHSRHNSGSGQNLSLMINPVGGLDQTARDLNPSRTSSPGVGVPPGYHPAPGHSRSRASSPLMAGYGPGPVSGPSASGQQRLGSHSRNSSLGYDVHDMPPRSQVQDPYAARHAGYGSPQHPSGHPLQGQVMDRIPPQQAQHQRQGSDAHSYYGHTPRSQEMPPQHASQGPPPHSHNRSPSEYQQVQGHNHPSHRQPVPQSTQGEPARLVSARGGHEERWYQEQESHMAHRSPQHPQGYPQHPQHPQHSQPLPQHTQHQHGNYLPGQHPQSPGGPASDMRYGPPPGSSRYHDPKNTPGPGPGPGPNQGGGSGSSGGGGGRISLSSILN